MGDGPVNSATGMFKTFFRVVMLYMILGLLVYIFFIVSKV